MVASMRYFLAELDQPTRYSRDSIDGQVWLTGRISPLRPQSQRGQAR